MNYLIRKKKKWDRERDSTEPLQPLRCFPALAFGFIGFADGFTKHHGHLSFWYLLCVQYLPPFSCCNFLNDAGLLALGRRPSTMVGFRNFCSCPNCSAASYSLHASALGPPDCFPERLLLLVLYSLPEMGRISLFHMVPGAT